MIANAKRPTSSCTRTALTCEVAGTTAHSALTGAARLPAHRGALRSAVCGMVTPQTVLPKVVTPAYPSLGNIMPRGAADGRRTVGKQIVKEFSLLLILWARYPEKQENKPYLRKTLRNAKLSITKSISSIKLNSEKSPEPKRRR